MQAESPVLVFLVAAYIYKRWRTSSVQAKAVVGGTGGKCGAPVHRGQQNCPGAGGARVGCTSLFTVGGGWGL